jgi:hypothetical protein
MPGNLSGPAGAPGPLAIIVTGLPSTGKTRLARRISKRFRLPLACKDDYKEAFFDTLGWGDRAWSRQLGQAAGDALRLFLVAHARAGEPCIIESNFPPEAAPELRAMQQAHPFRPFQIVCRTEGPVLLARFRARVGRRHPGHGDEALAEDLAPLLLAGEYAPLEIGGKVYEVDTTDFDAVNYDGLKDAIEQELLRGS